MISAPNGKRQTPTLTDAGTSPISPTSSNAFSQEDSRNDGKPKRGFSVINAMQKARLEHEKKLAKLKEQATAMHKVVSGTSVKAATGFEDEKYWEDLARRTDTRSRLQASAH